MTKKQSRFLLVIFLLGLGLRIVGLSQIPANLSRDELELASRVGEAIGYRLWLLRLPFAVAFSLTIPALVYALFRLQEKTSRLITNPGVWTGLLLVVSPWHLLLSRRAEFFLTPWRQLSLANFIERFFSFLSLKYLFLTGDPVFLLTANSGLLLSISLLGMLLAVIVSRRFDQISRLGLVLVLTGTGLSSLQPHTVNGKALVVALFGWSILSGWGLAESARFLLSGRKKFGAIVFSLMVVTLIHQSVTSVQNVMVHSKKLSEGQWELIYLPVAEYLVAHQAEYEMMVVNPRYAMPAQYLEWYSRGGVDSDKLVIDRQRDKYARPGVLYLGPIDERESYSVAYLTLEEFGLPTGGELLFAGVVK